LAGKEPAGTISSLAEYRATFNLSIPLHKITKLTLRYIIRNFHFHFTLKLYANIFRQANDLCFYLFARR